MHRTGQAPSTDGTWAASIKATFQPKICAGKGMDCKGTVPSKKKKEGGGFKLQWMGRPAVSPREDVNDYLAPLWQSWPKERCKT